LGNYDPGYARNRVLVKGMSENGAEVVCCNGGSTGGIVKFWRLMIRYLKIPNKRFDLIIVVFPPQQTMVVMAPLLFFMRLFRRTPVVVDMLTSHYEGYILDRKKYPLQSFHAKWYKWLDQNAVRQADFAIVNCTLGGKFLTDELGIPAKKMIVVFNGADDDLLKKSEKNDELKDPGKFMVNFHGNFMPLHGVPYIVQAAQILKNENILFQIVGKGHDYDTCRKMADELGLKNIIWTGRIPYENLPAYVNRADVCLGIFGDTSKTESVIPNKIFEVIAMGKPIITADTEAVREIFKDGETILFCRKADPDSLAKAILKLKNDTELMNKITQNSYALFMAKFNKKAIAKDLIDALKAKGYPVRGPTRLKGVVGRRSLFEGRLTSNGMKILIAGFPYVRQSYSDVFKYYRGNDNIYFLLPKVWKIKNGKVVYRPPVENNVFTTETYFHHSRYPILGGLLKGWMPWLPFFLFRQRKKRFDIIFSATEPSLLTALYQSLWAKIFGIKHILFTWENVPYQNKFRGFNLFFKRMIIKLNMFLSDAIVCGNKKAATIMREYTQKPTPVIPMSGVDTDFFTSDGSRKSFQGKDYGNNVVFSFAGAIGYRKGVHLAIKAFSELSKVIVNARLIIAGSGEYEKEIDELIEKSEAKDAIVRVSWLDKVQLRELLNVSDIFLYPSIPHAGWQEQFGYSIAEASLMEKPVISTKSGSIDELIIDDVSGILINPNNTEELREAMLKLGQNRELREKMGKEARRFMIENFGHEVVAAKFKEFFHSLITRSKLKNPD